MRIHLFSTIVILILTTLPTSLTAPPIDRLSAHPFAIRCRKHHPDPRHPSTRHLIAPFPSHCRNLAATLRSMPESTRPKIFDRRSPETQIPVPFKESYETCNVQFLPNPDPLSPKPNYATYTNLALGIEKMVGSCFDVGPGQESRDFVASIVIYDGYAGPSSQSNFAGGMSGPSLPNEAESANVTAMEGGFDAAEIAAAWASLNGSTSGLFSGGSGTTGQGRVDVT